MALISTENLPTPPQKNIVIEAAKRNPIVQ